ncbi:type II secretion system minor pseudopilin GspK [Pseudomonas orientalis]|uniref:Type II secretion system protein K n=1 Tax=Pseudomonas orientalis TaxID=76758 RepID=A0A1H2DWQ4_9PSED|nr:type II secretion system minor pseudopilin GspK [Pseudomonas orientalis]KRP62064.1 HxcX atypical pseudopilin [Pseudomonas orientalis]SDT87270.1 type II secretion system protein K (GspK) [Pseudomonas orientalis]
MKSQSPTVAKQRGTAIISALLIVTVVAVIAAGMLTRQSIFTRSLEAEQARVQGSALLLGGLEVSRQLLRDAREHDALTRLDQPWARPINTAQDGQFEGHLEDQQGKFNLRNLVAREHVDLGQVRSFERLCDMIGIEAHLAQRISRRVIAAYPRRPVASASGQPGPLLPATQPMLRTLDQLRGIDGLSERLLARLARYVSIIPANTWVNSNTASAEVLAAVVPGLSLSQAGALVAERDRGQWFVNRGDFVNRVQLPNLSVDELRVGVTSEWFMLHGQAHRNQRRVHMDALLHRPEDAMPKVIWSRLGV